MNSFTESAAREGRLRWRREKLFVLSLLIVGGSLLYATGLHGAYFADDFKYVFNNPSANVFQFFVSPNPTTPFYRPMQSMVLATIQSIFGTNTFPIHVLVLFFHILLSFYVYKIAFELHFTRLQSALSAAVMLASQINALAVLSNDTFSQVAGTFFEILALWSFHRFHSRTPGSEDRKPPRITFFAASVVCFTISLLMKESGLSAPGGIAVIALGSHHGEFMQRLRRSLPEVLPFLGVAVVYILVRSAVVVGHPDPRYDTSVGFNLIENVLMMVYAALLPVSTVSIFTLYREGNPIALAAISLVPVALLVIMSSGIARFRKPFPLKGLITIACLSLLPMVLFRHISELYVYNAMPAFSLLAGCGLGSIGNTVVQSRSGRILFGLLLAVMMVSHGFAVHQKARLMTKNGERATHLVQRIVPLMADVPRNGNLVLLNPVDPRPEYSVFLMHGFNVLLHGTNILGQVSGREDIRVSIVEGRDGTSGSVPPATLVLSLMEDSVCVCASTSSSQKQP